MGGSARDALRWRICALWGANCWRGRLRGYGKRVRGFSGRICAKGKGQRVKVKVSKDGRTFLMLDIPTLVSMLLFAGPFPAKALPMPYQITVTLGDGQSETVTVEPEPEG